MANNMYVELKEVWGINEANELIKKGWNLINVVSKTDYYTNDSTAIDNMGNTYVVNTNMNCVSMIVYIMGITKGAKVLYEESSGT